MSVVLMNTVGTADAFTEFKAILTAYDVPYVVKESVGRPDRYVVYMGASTYGVMVYIDFAQDVYQAAWDAEITGLGVILLDGSKWRVTDEVAI